VQRPSWPSTHGVVPGRHPRARNKIITERDSPLLDFSPANAGLSSVRDRVTRTFSRLRSGTRSPINRGRSPSNFSRKDRALAAPPRRQLRRSTASSAQPKPCRAPQELGGAVGVHPIVSQSPGRPPDDREPEERSPAVASPRHHPPLPPSKQNEFPTSLRFIRRRWHPKRTTVAQYRRNSGELRQPVMVHCRSARWRRRPLPNLICTVHHKPSG
jgi:hypothetical protein